MVNVYDLSSLISGPFLRNGSLESLGQSILLGREPVGILNSKPEGLQSVLVPLDCLASGGMFLKGFVLGCQLLRSDWHLTALWPDTWINPLMGS